MLGTMRESVSAEPAAPSASRGECPVSLSAALYDIMHRDADMPIAEYKGRTFAKGEYAALADRVIVLLDEAGIGRGVSIGVIVRNRPLHAAAMLGLIAGERWLT